MRAGRAHQSGPRVTSARRWWWVGLVGVLLRPATAAAQSTGQLWANGIVNWYATDLLTFRVNTELKSNPFEIDVTPRAVYTLTPWLDAVVELDVGHEVDQDTTLTPRIGVWFHILSRILERRAEQREAREKPPRRRLVVSTLLRFEDDEGTWRFRDRFAIAFPLNRRKTTDPGALYLTTDNEVFIPLDRTPGEALVSKMRYRAGLGYRESFGWGFEALYIWNGTRRAGTGPLVQESHAFDVRVIRSF